MDRDFTAEKPGEKLVSDLTDIATDEGFWFLACVIDVCTRRVVSGSAIVRIVTAAMATIITSNTRHGFSPRFLAAVNSSVSAADLTRYPIAPAENTA